MEVVANMQDFIWTLFPENASLNNLILKLEQIQNEILRPNKVDFEIILNETIKSKEFILPLDFNRLNIGLFRKICIHGVRFNINLIQVVISEDFVLYKIPFNENESDSISDVLSKFKHRFEAIKNIQNGNVEIRISIPKFSY